MVYNPVTPTMGIQPIASSSAVQNHAAGMIVQATDPVFGSGEFVYLKGAAGTTPGFVVTYDASGTSSAAVPVANTPSPVAVAMSANGANQWGWYQITGNAVLNKTNTVAIPLSSPVWYDAANAGNVFGTATAGRQIEACRAIATAALAATAVTCTIARPSLQGQIT
jgi:hypothetical protein